MFCVSRYVIGVEGHTFASGLPLAKSERRNSVDYGFGGAEKDFAFR